MKRSYKLDPILYPLGLIFEGYLKNNTINIDRGDFIIKQSDIIITKVKNEQNKPNRTDPAQSRKTQSAINQNRTRRERVRSHFRTCEGEFLTTHAVLKGRIAETLGGEHMNIYDRISDFNRSESRPASDSILTEPVLTEKQRRRMFANVLGAFVLFGIIMILLALSVAVLEWRI